MTNEKIKAYKDNPAGTIFGLMEHIRPKKCKMVNGGNRMTNKEAIEQFKKRLAITFYRKQIPEYYKAIEMAVEALEKADKYRWHDLRKNPDDLPEADEFGGSDYVLVKTGCFEWNDMKKAYYSHNKKQWSIDEYVFAWRYIEPFEEEEEE